MSLQPDCAGYHRIATLSIRLISLAVLTSLAACTPTRFTSPFLTVISQASGPTGRTIPVVATCRDGETRIGGGFLVTPDNSNRGMVVRESYPSEPNSWTVEVENTAPAEGDSSAILAVTYCARRADLALMAAVQTKGTAAAIEGGVLTPKVIVHVPCPPATALTGWGFRVDGPLNGHDAQYNAAILESAPEGQAWHVEVGQALHPGGTRLVQAFAVCTSGLQPGSPIVQSTTPVAGALTITEAICDPTQYTTAGGFRLNGSGHGNPDGTLAASAGRAFQSATVNEFLRWRTDTTTVAPGTPVTAVALCAPIP